MQPGDPLLEFIDLLSERGFHDHRFGPQVAAAFGAVVNGVRDLGTLRVLGPHSDLPDEFISAPYGQAFAADEFSAFGPERDEFGAGVPKDELRLGERHVAPAPTDR